VGGLIISYATEARQPFSLFVYIALERHELHAYDMFPWELKDFRFNLKKSISNHTARLRASIPKATENGLKRCGIIWKEVYFVIILWEERRVEGWEIAQVHTISISSCQFLKDIRMCFSRVSLFHDIYSH
jgi:hypothetical protein